MAEQKVKLTQLPLAPDTVNAAQLLVNQNDTDQRIPVTHFLRSKNNLSDITNAEQARANLNVPSVEDLNNKIGGLIDGSSTFSAGASLASPTQYILDAASNSWYYWSGAYPKSVPAASTPESTGGVGPGAWVSVGDATLRGQLAQGTGASMVGLGDEHTVYDIIGTGISDGDALIPVIQPYPGAVQTSQHLKNAENLSVADWGAQSGVDSSIQAQKMIDDTGMLIVPEGFTLVAKNLNLASASKVLIFGKMTLPDGCVDFDRALYADSNNLGLQIFVNEIDGNREGQSGLIGTHLLYFTRCENMNVYVKYAHDNYFSRAYTPVPSPDGMRNESSGCLYFYQCHNSQFVADLIKHWGREGIFVLASNRCIMALGHAQGLIGSVGDEYSGFQFSGDYNRLLYASVDNSQASCGSFDCRWSVAGRLVLTNNKFFGSLGMGHPGYPTVDSVIESVVSIGSAANGIQFASGSSGNRVLSATIISPGAIGINQSDGANNNFVNNFIVRDPASSHVTSFQSTLTLTNGDLTSNANNVTKLNASGGGAFTVRNVRLDPAKQLQLTSFGGLAGNSSATITDGNITPYSQVILLPSNANGALANAYISSYSNGSCVISTASGGAAGSGASFRYMVV